MKDTTTKRRGLLALCAVLLTGALVLAGCDDPNYSSVSYVQWDDSLVPLSYAHGLRGEWKRSDGQLTLVFIRPDNGTSYFGCNSGGMTDFDYLQSKSGNTYTLYGMYYQINLFTATVDGTTLTISNSHSTDSENEQWNGLIDGTYILQPAD
jgi:hypothetical protein